MTAILKGRQSLATALIARGTPSIRQICQSAIIAAVREPAAEPELKAMAKGLIERYHPTSQALPKFSKHYGWYKATMKKANELNLTD